MTPAKGITDALLILFFAYVYGGLAVVPRRRKGGTS